MSGEIVVIGGFTESKRVLEPVAEAAAVQGIEDFEILTLREAMSMDEERLRKLTGRAHVLTHSAGVMALPDAKGASSYKELPWDLLVVAGPEPRQAEVLRHTAISKTLDHIFGPTGHRRRDHLRVAGSNIAESIAHPFVNLALARDIGSFSTLKALDSGRIAAASRVGSFIMEDDEFYAPQPGLQDTVIVEDLARAGTVITEIPGRHDELLIDPSGVLDSMGDAFAAADRAYAER